jgi:formylglycine-generating enzyme required for sulfatase activity
MFEEIPLPESWPVYVSQAEAEAYARWAHKALPTEEQFHRAAFGSPEGTESLYPWGSERPGPPHGNFDFQAWTPLPVGSFPAGSSAFGVLDLIGNGWEWTRTAFAPFPGFEPFPFYSGYSADFFDGKHFVLKGASPQTSASLVRRSFRNWFQPHYPNIYATFRCVEN